MEIDRRSDRDVQGIATAVARAGACAILALGALCPPEAPAQAVSGRLVDAGSGQPVVGALVTLLDADGEEVATTVSSSRGTYHVRAPAAGRYRLRAERIGFETTTSEPVALTVGQTASLELRSSSSPVALPALAVESEAECHVRPEEGEATYVLWEEARKALRVTERTATEYRFEGVLYERHVNLWGEPLEQGDVEFISVAGRHPFRSVPLEELEAQGYARKAPEGTYFFGPDPEILLSDGFLDSHCFRYRGRGDEPVVGLAFEPIRERGDRVDVEGVLWLDRQTSQLRTLEYRYTNVEPPAELGSGPGPYGRMVFEQLPDGGWIVSDWWIRAPAGSRPRGVRRYLTYSQEGGRIDRAEPLSVGRADRRPVPSVYGPPSPNDSSAQR